jgi:hypothetical protein
MRRDGARQLAPSCPVRFHAGIAEGEGHAQRRRREVTTTHLVRAYLKALQILGPLGGRTMLIFLCSSHFSDPKFGGRGRLVKDEWP